MKRKGFTLIELLVVVAIIALLVSILMPALGRARELANQVKCATQLKGIGSAIALYQNDFGDRNPGNYYGSSDGNNYYGRKGFEGADYWYAWDTYGDTLDTEKEWWELYPQVNGALFLLVKYEDLVPNMFVCPSADYAQEMDLSEATSDQDANVEGWGDCLTFASWKNCCYSYNDPANRLLDAGSSSGLVVLADLNNAYDASSISSFTADTYVVNTDLDTLDQPDLGTAYDSAADEDKPEGALWSEDELQSGGTNPEAHGNSPNHATEVQNILYADSHVKKENSPIHGVSEDNIYTDWGVSNLTDATSEEDALYQGYWGNSGVFIDPDDTNLGANSSDTFLVN